MRQRGHCVQEVEKSKSNTTNTQRRSSLSDTTSTTSSRIPDSISLSDFTMSASLVSRTNVSIAAAVYVLSGVSQPLIMTLCKEAGLANPTAQLYMVFYYIGPSFLIIPAIYDKSSSWPSLYALMKASGIAAFDIGAQTLNYTGASLAGPTLFAIIYSSVTVWTAVFSRCFLDRSLHYVQWCSVLIVFFGLTLTATSSIKLGPDVMNGTLLILFGSCAHAATYVMSEAVMTGHDKLTVLQNTSVQGIVACVFLLLWQLFYTIPHFNQLIGEPVEDANTSLFYAIIIMLGFAVANLLHSVTFYTTIKHYPGGATSAGVMKGLQAVLVFMVSHVVYCGRFGGDEMCFSLAKFESLLVVVGGVITFSFFQKDTKRSEYTNIQMEAPVDV